MLTRKKISDPVCGMEIKVNHSTPSSHYHKGEYYFCSANCLTKFYTDPQKYAVDFNDDCCEGGHFGKMGHRHGGHQHYKHCGGNNGHKHKCH